jgi:threonine dehydrogenase-like Zn-dependent dehydrogenase
MPHPGNVEIREYELPPPQPGALLLETISAGICGSEVHIFTNRHPLKSVVLGHEMIGRVLDPSTRPVDSAGTPLSAGDRVSVVYFQGCQHCPACARGKYELCSNGYAQWMQSPDEFPHFVGTCGTHYYLNPNQFFFRVPDELPSLVATSANCALSQVMAGIDRGEVQAGEHVVIQGAGGLGLYAIAVAKERGATVTVLDMAENRLETARKFGADQVISLHEHPDAAQRRDLVFDATGGQGADVAIDLTGMTEAIIEGVGLVRVGGRYVTLGNVLPGAEVTIDFGDITRRAITIIPAVRYAPRFLKNALRFLWRNLGTVPFDLLVDKTYPLDEVGAALEDSAQRRINRAALVFE